VKNVKEYVQNEYLQGAECAIVRETRFQLTSRRWGPKNIWMLACSGGQGDRRGKREVAKETYHKVKNKLYFRNESGCH
jgi:hypothetical protein